MKLRAALYARYSTNKQRKESIEDQLRVCKAICDREGFEAILQFSDEAISGGTTRRPGYQAMLGAARHREFDVLVAEDTSRLWRNMAEQAPRLAELEDLGINVVLNDLDTRSSDSNFRGSVNGAMSEEYRRKIGALSFRGNEGNALNKLPTGGRPYGYETVIITPRRTPRDRDVTERRVVPEQAEVVRFIYRSYAEGKSPRWISNDLNGRGVPSPGANWDRTKSDKPTHGKWLASAIHGDPDAGTGILCNPIYRGQVVWNRVHWVRSRVDSAKRWPVPNDPSKWIVHQIESLRIVSDELWQAVQARRIASKQEARPVEYVRDKRVAGRRVLDDEGNAVKVAVQSRGGRRHKYALSGLLKCAECGASYTISGTNQYACATHLNGGENACPNDRRVQRTAMEETVAEVIRAKLLTPERIEVMRKHLASRLASKAKDSGATEAQRVAKLAAAERTLANLMNAVKAGIISPTLSAELRAAEAERDRLAATPAEPSPRAVKMLPDAVARYKALVADLPKAFGKDPERARNLIRRLVGSVRMVRQQAESGRWVLYAELEIQPSRLLGLAGVTPREAASGLDGSGGRI